MSDLTFRRAFGPAFFNFRPAAPSRLKTLAEMLQVETLKTIKKHELEAVAERGATRPILPSIIKPILSSSEPVEPVRRKRSSRGKADQAQSDIAVREAASETVKAPPAETPAISEAVSHVGYAPVVEADPTSGPEAQPRGARKSRSKSPEANAQATASKSIVEPKHAPESEMIEPASVVSSKRTGQSWLTKRQVAAAQLPRHERWKWRLHPASW